MKGVTIKVGPQIPGFANPPRLPPTWLPDWTWNGQDVSRVGHDFGNGLFTRNGTLRPTHTISNSDVRDGLSRTFAIGEAVPVWCDWSWWYGWNGCTATCALPINHRLDLPDRRKSGFHDVFAESDGFHSRHSHGANFGMLDGSVQFVVDRIDYHVYRALATYEDARADLWHP